MKHIQQETRCRVQIKGRNSGFTEHGTNQESNEPMYLHVALVSSFLHPNQYLLSEVEGLILKKSNVRRSYVKICLPMSGNSTNVSKRTLLSKGVMGLEAIKEIVKAMEALAVDTVDTEASSPQQLLLPFNHLRQVHLEPQARQITAPSTPNIMAPVARIPTQLMVVIRIMWRTINITHSRLHSNQLPLGLLLQAHRAMILHLHHHQVAPLLPLMVTIIL